MTFYFTYKVKKKKKLKRRGSMLERPDLDNLAHYDRGTYLNIEDEAGRKKDKEGGPIWVHRWPGRAVREREPAS